MAEIDPKSLSGAARAAILMLFLGEEISAKLFKELSSEDVKKVSHAIANLGIVDDELAHCILEECHESLLGDHPKIHGNFDYVKKVVESAYGPEDAREILRTLSLQTTTRSHGLATLRRADPKQLANLLQSEHPQTVALVVSNLEGDHAAQTLSLLPEKLRYEVSMRMARLEHTNQSLRNRVLSTLASKVGGGELYGQHHSGSLRAVAELLNRMDRSVSAQCLEMIENEDASLALAIRELMFVFDDILMLNDADMRKIIQRVDRNTLVKALKGTHQELRDQFYRNMSERAKEMLREDMEAVGPIPVADAEGCQQEVVKTIRLMESEGEIDLSGQAGDQYVV